MIILFSLSLFGSTMGLMMTMQNRIDITVFSKELMRVHDNPTLLHSIKDGSKVIPLYVGLDCDSIAVENLRLRLGVKKLYSADSPQKVKDFVKTKACQYASHAIRILYYKDISSIMKVINNEDIIKVDFVEVNDFLHDESMTETDLDALVMANPVYSASKGKLYSTSALSKYVPRPNIGS